MKNTAGGFKTRLALLDRQINKAKRQLEILTRREKRSREVWTKAYHAFMKAVNDLTNLTRHGTQKEAALKDKIKSWPAETVRLTKERDAIRGQIRDVEQNLTKIGTEKAMLSEQEVSETKTIDEIVTQVFALNEAVVRASTDRESCLNRHVFPRLVDGEGKLYSQVSFTSSNGLRRVVAMVNTMTIVRGDLADEAKQEIQRFFDRFQQQAKMDQSIKALYDLTRELLVEKIDFKVGPGLSQFIAIDLDPQIFPELSRAQALLRSSIRSEKTNSYIRIYQRASRTDNWEVVPQS